MALNVTRPSRFKSYFAHLETRDEEVTVYTCPANSVAYMSLIFLVNNDNSNTSDHSVDLYRAQDDETYHILTAKNLNSAELFQFSGAFIVLEPKLRKASNIRSTSEGASAYTSPSAIST